MWVGATVGAAVVGSAAYEWPEEAAGELVKQRDCSVRAGRGARRGVHCATRASSGSRARTSRRLRGAAMVDDR